MKSIVKLVGMSFLLVFLLQLGSVSKSYGQCAMCTLNAEESVKNGNEQGKGLNAGILFLLAMPYLAAGAVGYLWYKKYKRKSVEVHLKRESIHLN